MTNPVKRKPAAKKRAKVAKPIGRPPYEPSQETREKVEILIAGGESEEDIARVVGLSRTTLRQHFAEELATGRAKRRADVLIAQYRTAVAGNASAQDKFLKKSDLPVFQPQAPKEPKLGKKEIALRDAQRPEPGTPLGDLMMQRLSGRPN
jgi:hypothetical protein